MSRPIIGISSHSLTMPVPQHAAMGSLPRSAVGQQYVDAVVAAGGVPVSIPLGLDEDGLRHVFEVLDGLLLPGGDDVAPELYGEQRHPDLGAVDLVRDQLELYLARLALASDLPVLGICRGIQVLAVAAGGTLYQDLPSQLGSPIVHDGRGFTRDHLLHPITIEPTSYLAGLLATTTTDVNSFHHQAVRTVPSGFTVSALAPDGVIEGIEVPDHQFVIGIQCHPEGIWQTTAPRFAELFRGFVSAAQRRRLAA